MCYLVAKKVNISGCIALRTKFGKELADFVDALQEELGYDIQIITISRPSAYKEYEPYYFVQTYKEFAERARKL